MQGWNCKQKITIRVHLFPSHNSGIASVLIHTPVGYPPAFVPCALYGHHGTRNTIRSSHLSHRGDRTASWRTRHAPATHSEKKYRPTDFRHSSCPCRDLDMSYVPVQRVGYLSSFVPCVLYGHHNTRDTPTQSISIVKVLME